MLTTLSHADEVVRDFNAGMKATADLNSLLGIKQSKLNDGGLLQYVP